MCIYAHIDHSVVHSTQLYKCNRRGINGVMTQISMLQYACLSDMYHNTSILCTRSRHNYGHIKPTVAHLILLMIKMIDPSLGAIYLLQLR